MEKSFRQIQIVHLGFVWAWFCFLFIFKFVAPIKSDLPSYFPLVMGLVSITDITIGFFRRKQNLSAAREMLLSDPESRSGIGRWRVANILSFAFAQTVTLFGFVLRFLGWDWNIAGIFYAVGLLLLLLWAPRRIQAMPRGLR